MNGSGPEVVTGGGPGHHSPRAPAPLNTEFGVPRGGQLREFGLPEPVIRKVADAAILAFDVDDTLNAGRGRVITEEAAELIYKSLLLGKRTAIISGRTFDEFREINTLEPLLRRMRERNMQSELTIYTAGGGEKVILKADGSFTHDMAYGRPYSELESRQIVAAIREKDAALNSAHNLREQGIKPYWLNYRNLAYQWSPYGKKDESQYKFESDPSAQGETPPRLTRKELGAEIVASLKAAGLDDVEFVVSGKTTVGFSRRGITKEKAMLDLLESGRVAYFGDEVSRHGAKTGNDNVIGEMAVAHAEKLTVISLDEKRGELPPGVVYVGGKVAGTMQVLLETQKFCETEAHSRDLNIQTVRQILAGYDLGVIKEIRPLNAGQGMHSPFYEIDAERGQFVLRHIRADLFKDPLEAARHEVFVVNTWRERNIPFAEILPLRSVEAAKPEDRFISLGPDRCCHLLYRYVPGEVGSFDTMNDARFNEMVSMLARMHRTLAETRIPYEREHVHPNALDIRHRIPQLRELRDVVAEKKRENPHYRYTRGERLVLENADFIIEQLETAVENLKGSWSVLPRVPIHSDYHPPNVIFNGDKIVGVIDLEHMRVEPRIYDLAPLTRLGTEKGIFHLENARRVVLSYNQGNKLTPEEVEALPEIFRLKLLDRVCRLVNPGRHFEGRGFDFNGTPEKERSIAIIDRNDGLFLWYQNLITSLRDLDVRVTHGDFRRVVQDKIESERRTGDELKEEYLRNLRGKRLAHEIPITPLKEFDLSPLIANGIPVEKLAIQEPGRWSQNGNFYYPCRKGEYGWCQLRIGDRVLFQTDKVVVYQVPGRDIHLQIRGNDLDAVKRNMEMAHIVIVVGGRDRAREVRMLPRSNRDLSRSSMAIQLTDSGIFDGYPALQNLLRYQLVWQDVDGGLRHRELLDAHDIRMDLLSRVESRPQEVTGEELSSIIHFRRFKSKVVRQAALEVIGKIYDSGRISRAEYINNVGQFIAEDIYEDFRVIERGVKNDPDFLRELSRNLFQGDSSGRGISAVSLEYADQRRTKSIYKAVFRMADGREEHAAVTLMRHDPITPKFGLTMTEIERAIEVWRTLSGRVAGIPTFGGWTRETDYRGKDLVSGGAGELECRDTFVNNIVVCAHRFISGPTLSQILSDPEIPADQKREAVEACRQASLLIYEQSKALTGKGYFMERPESYKFIVNRRDDGIKVSITDPQRLVDYPSAVRVEHMFAAAIRKDTGAIGFS